MAINYSKYSPYYATETYGNFLDVLNYRPVRRSNEDTLFAITKFYEYRPDLLANDLYQKSSLWWVFAARNPNTLRDPIFDFVVGQKIYLPDAKSLLASLGI